MAERKFRTAIADAEWVITAQLTQGPDNHPVGPPIEMHFADSWVAHNVEVKHAAPVDWLVWRRIDEAIPGLKKIATKMKRESKK